MCFVHVKRVDQLSTKLPETLVLQTNSRAMLNPSFKYFEPNCNQNTCSNEQEAPLPRRAQRVRRA